MLPPGALHLLPAEATVPSTPLTASRPEPAEGGRGHGIRHLPGLGGGRASGCAPFPPRGGIPHLLMARIVSHPQIHRPKP